MKLCTPLGLTGILVGIIAWTPGLSVARSTAPLVIAIPSDASYMETLAGQEIGRYLYVRTGKLVPVVGFSSEPLQGDAIVVSRKNRPLASQQGKALEAQQYSISTQFKDSRKVIWIIGGDDVGTLYGAYRFAELLGVRFFMHGDLIPDEKIPLQLPDVHETGKPLFETRGIQPFHDFPEGPDWWNEEEYKALFSQLPKLRMNFFGLHTYPEKHPNAEPTVWIGLPQDVQENGDVRFSYPASYQNTQRGNWGYKPKWIQEYSHGASDLFALDVYGADVMGTSFPRPETVEQSNAVFNRTGRMLNRVFHHARRLGIQTCVGTETPLTIPAWLQKRLREMGKDPSSPSVVREVYEGMFQRIMKSYPVDYYWFWTPETWIWSGSKEEQISATVNDLQTAMQAAKNVRAPFTLATCGWVLGPESDRSLFDRTLPKEMPMSCINREVGKAPVQPAFSDISGRPLWAIPWLEDDPALLNAQLWVGRMRADAADALRYGCSGLLGIHWRTRILGPNVSALAHAAWDEATRQYASQRSTGQDVEGPIGGQYLVKDNVEIQNTEDDPLYRTARKGMAAYRIKVPDGSYIVTLHFCELEGRSANRSFSVSIQGKAVLPRLHIASQFGENQAVSYTFSNIDVNDGWLEIKFASMVNQPCISALSVSSNTFTKKINCGGPAYRDYQADWPPSPVLPRHLPSDDFYRDWALHQFGSNVAEPVAEIFASLDGTFPCPSTWVQGPGGLRPDSRSWDEVKSEYAFLDALESIQSRIKGKGNKARFDYWYRQFEFMKFLAKTKCLWGKWNKIVSQDVKTTEDIAQRKTIVKEKVLPLAEEMMEAFSQAYTTILPTVSNSGEMGTITNLEQHVMDLMITQPCKQLSDLIQEEVVYGNPLPADYTGPPRLIVPTVRTMVSREEGLALKVILLDTSAPRHITLYWRPMGKGTYQRIPVTHLRRGVYKVAFPDEALEHSHIEYYLKAGTGSGKTLYFPATAPHLNQTVVVMP